MDLRKPFDVRVFFFLMRRLVLQISDQMVVELDREWKGVSQGRCVLVGVEAQSGFVVSDFHVLCLFDWRALECRGCCVQSLVRQLDQKDLVLRDNSREILAVLVRRTSGCLGRKVLQLEQSELAVLECPTRYRKGDYRWQVLEEGCLRKHCLDC